MSASPSWLSGDVETQAAHATRVKAEFGTNAEDADGPSDTRSLCNAHPVKAVVATVDVKFETVGAPGADVEVALEAVAAEAELKSVGIVVAEASAAEAEFKEEANAEVTNNVAKATVMEANFTAVGAHSVSISAAASDQVGLQITSEMNSSRLVVLLLRVA